MIATELMNFNYKIFFFSGQEIVTWIETTRIAHSEYRDNFNQCGSSFGSTFR